MGALHVWGHEQDEVNGSMTGLIASMGAFKAIARDTTAQQGAIKDSLMADAANPGANPAGSTGKQLALENAKIQQAVNDLQLDTARNQFKEADARRRREIQNGTLFG